MARYTQAYSAFISRLDEVERLRRLAAAKERMDPVGLRRDTNALCRGSVVLLSSHLEAFVKELGELALDSMTAKRVPRTQLSPQFYYHISKDFLTELQEASDPEKIADKVFAFIQGDSQFWSKTGPFPVPVPSDRFNQGFSNPAFRKIKKYFNRFGYTEYSRDLASQLKGRYTPAVNMVDHLVDTRNKIAHGDPNAGKTPAEVADMMSIVRHFCSSTDSVFSNWWKSNFCTIR